MERFCRMETGRREEGGHRVAADVPADETAAVVALKRLTNAPEGGAVGTAGAEGLIALRQRSRERPEFFPVFRGNRGRIDPQDPSHGGGHKVRIQLPDHREGSVVLPVKGLDPDLPRLFRGEDLHLVFEKREHLLDDQDLLGASADAFSAAPAAAATSSRA